MGYLTRLNIGTALAQDTPQSPSPIPEPVPKPVTPTADTDTMTDAEVIAAAMQRVSADTEKLTRRNMKQCVSEHVQAKCQADAAFARLAMVPGKTMAGCFKYIYRKAQDFAQEEMKMEDNDHENGMYGCDVPDDLCYQWAEDYFTQPEKEQPVPRPRTASPGPDAPARRRKKPEKQPEEGTVQLSLLDGGD